MEYENVNINTSKSSYKKYDDDLEKKINEISLENERLKQQILLNESNKDESYRKTEEDYEKKLNEIILENAKLNKEISNKDKKINEIQLDNDRLKEEINEKKTNKKINNSPEISNMKLMSKINNLNSKYSEKKRR